MPTATALARKCNSVKIENVLEHQKRDFPTCQSHVTLILCSPLLLQRHGILYSHRPTPTRRDAAKVENHPHGLKLNLVGLFSQHSDTATKQTGQLLLEYNHAGLCATLQHCSLLL